MSLLFKYLFSESQTCLPAGRLKGLKDYTDEQHKQISEIYSSVIQTSYDIVKAHGGELKVKTQKGQGTTFIVQLSVNKN